MKILGNTDYPKDTNDDYPILTFREQLLIYFMTQGNIKYISGHIPFSEKAYQNFQDNYAFVTMLRDPVKRFISSYIYNKYRNKRRFTINEDIVIYMESDFGQSQGFELVKFLGGADITGDYTSQRALGRAKENLHKFDIVGILENDKHFSKNFEDRFGVKLRIGRKNISPKSGSFLKSIITEELEERIRSICKPDLEVYQYAVKNFIKYDG